MVAYETTNPDNDTDFERRRALRSFLMTRRSHLGPTDFGLPRLRRRRIEGLRRDEVAELVGVSTNWYSAFESGRPIRVSPQFVARLAHALRLEPDQEMALFRLSIPELYRL
jgi:hypothetical protein